MNEKFESAYSERWRKLPPNDIAVSGFNALYSIAQGMEKAGSSDPDDVIDTLGGMSFASPMGELSYRSQDHQAKLNNIGYEVTDGSDESGWQWNRKVHSRYRDVIGEARCSVCTDNLLRRAFENHIATERGTN